MKKEVVICVHGHEGLLKAVDRLFRGAPVGVRELNRLDRARFAEMKNLCGLDIKPHERRGGESGDKGHTAEELLRTVRRDLLEFRKSILDGVPHKKLLRRVDYTLDQIENLLGEM